MNYLLFFFCLITGFFTLDTDNSALPNLNEKDKIHTKVDYPAQFIYSPLEMWIMENVKYSDKMKELNLYGDVKINCVIKKNGTIQNIHIIESSHEELTQEALRLAQKMPKWQPAQFQGKKVSSHHEFTIRFHPYNPIALQNLHNPSTPSKQDNFNPPFFPYGNPVVWVAQNVKYPTEAMAQGIEGKVYVSFIIDTDGRISNIHIMKKAHPLLDKAAYKVVCGMPRWVPGTVNGRPRPVRHTLPIFFKLDKDLPSALSL